MGIFNIRDEKFKKYGRIIENYNFSEIIKAMSEIECSKDVIYEASVESLESTHDKEILENQVYGGMTIQIGYCNGHNNKLNALEYHRDSEVNIAITDLILMLGSKQDITDEYTYESDNIEMFLIPKGTAVEIYATTLHYAPCDIDNNGFKCVVVLPKGTNTEIDFEIDRSGEGKLLFARNKWLIAHEDAKIDNSTGGILGENITL